MYPGVVTLVAGGDPLEQQKTVVWAPQTRRHDTVHHHPHNILIRVALARFGQVSVSFPNTEIGLRTRHGDSGQRSSNIVESKTKIMPKDKVVFRSDVSSADKTPFMKAPRKVR